jgi:hypothetical protein
VDTRGTQPELREKGDGGGSVMEAREPERVKLFVGVLARTVEWVDWAAEKLSDRYGPVEDRSDVIPFAFTTYYETEMGTGLLRVFLSFRDPVDPGRLAVIKRETNALEEAAGRGGGDRDGRPPPGGESEKRAHGRLVNLDPGYLSEAKLVLATTKDYSHRIYLAHGVYAEVTMLFRDGDFRPQPWTYPDYRTGAYRAFFRRVRERFRQQLRG